MAITDPRDIPDLVLWLSAEAVTGKADGATLSASDVQDLSGNGNHPVSVTGTPVWIATGGEASGPAFQFDGGDYFTFGNIMSGATSGEAFIRYRGRGTGNRGHWNWGTDSAVNHYPYSSSVYDDFGVNTRRTFVPAGVTYENWHTYNVWSAPSDWSAQFDGSTKRAYSDTTPVAWPTAPNIGSVWTTGSGVEIGGFALYSRKLTTTERADLEAFFLANPNGGTVGGVAPSPSGALAAVLPVASAALAGSYTPPVVTGSLAVALPAATAALSGTYASPPIGGTFATTLPVPTVELSGFYVDPGALAAGTLDARLPVPSMAFAGTYADPIGDGGHLAATLPAPTLTLAGTYHARNGYGLVLDSETTVDAEAPLPATPSDTGTPALVLHVITPTVPTPVLVNGRPS